ncbi:hypothetical protein BRAS3843_120124 [Bradyrhizobium sp. STM 3843]|uniref:hypothetical protein n=1 Tax=Bradyrhizobium sp. STM 3843 TaxID=551947 RepID=UPI000240A95F|nr:hypothetical protein [Bradyrhizobium sp. STM 3843]CCE04951.1 hypothetical protein BRAS3843_120124 [Bradyrhizobium sp. STM 3843]
MRGVSVEARPGAEPKRRRTLVPTLVLILLALMIVRDIMIRRWSGTGTAPPDVTRVH